MTDIILKMLRILKKLENGNNRVERKLNTMRKGKEKEVLKEEYVGVKHVQSSDLINDLSLIFPTK